MFVKVTKTKNYEYINLVESYWENGSARHRVLFNFGRADLIRNDESFLRVVKKLCEIARIPVNTNSDESHNLPDCSEAIFYNYGYLAYLKLWRNLGISEALENIQAASKTEFSVSDTALLMAIQHLLEPRSKLGTYLRQDRYFNWEEISLQHMYRTLDKLSESKEEIEDELFEQNYIRVNQKVDVVFYDVTTVAFESFRADELRNFGFSKDCKFKEVQIVMGLIIDINGMAVGYELFPGNTFDGKTMIAALGNIKKRFGIHRVIIVADRGLNSKGNLNLIKGAGYGYIMSSKIRGMSAAMQAKILEPDGFTVITDKSGKEEFRYKTMEYMNVFTDDDKVQHKLSENLIISYSAKRAKKDRQDRERLIEKARKLLKNPENIKSSNKRGGKKYLNESKPDQTTWTLAEEKIDHDSKFDGYYGIQTSETSMSTADIMDAYHTLWRIEESFRIMKSTLEIRRVFHWTPKRIKGHFMVCFLAFLMERKLELLLNGQETAEQVSPARIQESLNAMQLAAVTVKDEELFIKAKHPPLCNEIFKKLKIKQPSNISKKSDLLSDFRLDDRTTFRQLSLF
jgi:transposase